MLSSGPQTQGKNIGGLWEYKVKKKSFRGRWEDWSHPSHSSYYQINPVLLIVFLFSGITPMRYSNILPSPFSIYLQFLQILSQIGILPVTYLSRFPMWLQISCSCLQTIRAEACFLSVHVPVQSKEENNEIENVSSFRLHLRNTVCPIFFLFNLKPSNILLI